MTIREISHIADVFNDPVKSFVLLMVCQPKSDYAMCKDSIPNVVMAEHSNLSLFRASFESQDIRIYLKSLGGFDTAPLFLVFSVVGNELSLVDSCAGMFHIDQLRAFLFNCLKGGR